MISLYGRVRDVRKAKLVFEEMEASGITIDRAAYNATLVAIGSCGDIEGTLEVYEQMQGAGLQPDVSTYLALIVLYGRASRLRDVTRLLAQVRASSGGNVDQVLIDAAVTALQKSVMKPRSVGELLRELQELRWQPSAHTLSRLLSPFAK
eukprot:jgi/Mesen1/3454/ME000194S02600